MSGGSVLELFHPLGHAETVRVIGGDCSKQLSPCPEEINRTAGSADLVVVAPDGGELSTPGWLQNALREAEACLEPNGVLYVLAHRGRRRETRALLEAGGLIVTNELLHHPNWPEASTLIPLKPQTLEYAFSRLIRTHPVRRRIALSLLRLPGALALLRALLPYVGLVVQHRGAQAQSAWFTDLAKVDLPISGVVVNTSWRGRDGAVLLHGVDPTKGEATAIAKTWLSANGSEAVMREANGLQEIALRAATFGVKVPALLGYGRLGDQPYMAETAVTGEKVAVVIQDHPEQLEELLTRLSRWLLEWNSATAQPQVLTDELLDELLLRPAAQLLADADCNSAHERRLSALANRLSGKTAPFVAAHGDLTMVNVLADGEGRLGIIDWETASGSGLPLADFFYAAVDAVAALDDYRDRPAAFIACFSPRGRYRPLLACLEARFASALQLSADLVTLSFHASWLKFALQERRESAKTAPDEFLQIARQAATGRYEPLAGQGAVGRL